VPAPKGGAGGSLVVHVQGLERLPVLHTPAVDDLNRAVGRLRLRLGFERVALFTVRGAFASSLALALIALGIWYFQANSSLLWLAAAPLVAAAALALVRWPSRRETALAADRRLGLEERLATALELQEGQGARRFAALQVQDAALTAASARTSWLLLDRRSRNEAIAALGAVVLAIAAALLVPGVPRPQAPAAVPPPEVAESSVDAPVADQAVQRTLPMDTPDNQKVAAPPAQAATQSPGDLAARVQQEQAERSAMDQLSQALGDVSAGQPAANAIQQGDFDSARDQLQNLADNADQLSDAAKQQLARSLQDAAGATAQTDRALADREQQAAQALARSTYADQRQALRALADQVQRSGSRSVSSDQLERDQGQMEQASATSQQQQQPLQQQGQQQQQSPPSQLRSGTTPAQGNAGQSPAPSNSQGGPGNPNTNAQGGGDAQTAGGQGGEGAGQQAGAGVGAGADPNLYADQPSRLDTQGQQVQVPTRLGQGPGVRPTTGDEDQSTPDPRLGGRTVSELAQAQQTGQVIPEQNLVPGEQRTVVRGYFR
jgi:hypothetical protein